MESARGLWTARNQLGKSRKFGHFGTNWSQFLTFFGRALRKRVKIHHKTPLLMGFWLRINKLSNLINSIETNKQIRQKSKIQNQCWTSAQKKRWNEPESTDAKKWETPKHSVQGTSNTGSLEKIRNELLHSRGGNLRATKIDEQLNKQNF